MSRDFSYRFLARLGSLHRNSRRYSRLTQEVYRWDAQSIAEKSVQKDSVNEAVIAESLEFLHKLFNNPTQIRLSRHLKERLEGYIDTQSRDCTYIELYNNEYKFIMQKDTTFPENRHNVMMTELGFNHFDQVCKISAVLLLPTNRYLFMCFGVDGGMKTAYVTPEYKHRKNYRSKDSQITYS